MHAWACPYQNEQNSRQTSPTTVPRPTPRSGSDCAPGASPRRHYRERFGVREFAVRTARTCKSQTGRHNRGFLRLGQQQQPAHMEWLKNTRGVSFLNVPYKGASQAQQAVLTGEVQVAAFAIGPAVSQMGTGKAKVLARHALRACQTCRVARVLVPSPSRIYTAKRTLRRHKGTLPRWTTSL